MKICTIEKPPVSLKTLQTRDGGGMHSENYFPDINENSKIPELINAG